MMFSFIAKHRGIWPVALICETLGVSRSGFYAWLTRRRIVGVCPLPSWPGRRRHRIRREFAFL